MNNINKSKEISYILRHNSKGLTMSKDGYVLVSDLLEKINISFEELKEIVETNDKKRFAFSEDFKNIRASQGHTLKIDVELKKYIGKNIKFYHGTSNQFLESIKKSGLIPMKRQYVHFTDDKEIAIENGLRYAKSKNNLILFSVDTGLLELNKIPVYISDNNVYQIKQIPFKLLTLEKI